jgi:hypothetical protein
VARFTPCRFFILREEPALPIGQETEWVPEPVWTLWNAEKYLVPAGNKTPAVQSVASWYID